MSTNKLVRIRNKNQTKSNGRTLGKLVVKMNQILVKKPENLKRFIVVKQVDYEETKVDEVGIN
jgi:hypothetical protein